MVLEPLLLDPRSLCFFPPASFDASSLIFDFCIFEGEGVALAFRSIGLFSASAPELSIGTMVHPVIIAGESQSAEKGCATLLSRSSFNFAYFRQFYNE